MSLYELESQLHHLQSGHSCTASANERINYFAAPNGYKVGFYLPEKRLLIQLAENWPILILQPTREMSAFWAMQ